MLKNNVQKIASAMGVGPAI